MPSWARVLLCWCAAAGVHTLTEDRLVADAMHADDALNLVSSARGDRAAVAGTSTMPTGEIFQLQRSLKHDSAAGPLFSAQLDIPFRVWPSVEAKTASTEAHRQLQTGKRAAFSSFPSVTHCQTCAVVGSSSDLLVLNPPAGKDIDEADCVFRVKPHPTVGYEKYVGTKTDFTAMYMAMSDNMVGHTPPRLGYLWHTLRRFQLDDFLRLYASGKTRGLQHGTADLLVSPRSIDGALASLAHFAGPFPYRSDGRNMYPSIGMLTLSFVYHLDVCETLNLYGFGRLSNHTKYVHYYNHYQSTAMSNPSMQYYRDTHHEFALESRVYDAMDKANPSYHGIQTKVNWHVPPPSSG